MAKKKKNRTKSKVSPPKPTTVSISDLPELPLLTIFDYIPLPNLLHIDEVCRAWKKLKSAACSRRRHLIIASDQVGLKLLQQPTEINLVPVTVNNHNVLFIGRSRLLQTTLKRLFKLLPNLKVLRLARQQGSHEELSKVNKLLGHYRPQLVEVTIWFWGELTDGDFDESQFAFHQKFLWLMASLNRLTALRSLELNFRSPPNCPVVLNDRQLATHCLPDVVGRLTCLKFHTRLEGSNFHNNFPADARLLKQILLQMRDEKATATTKGTRNLQLYVRETPLTLKTLVSLGPGPVAAGLRSVSIDGKFSADSAAEYKALARFARQSPHLQAVAVSLKSLRIRRLAESLSSLKELVNLHIFCHPVPSSLPQSPVNIRHLPVLPSVSFLRLDFPANSHIDYDQLHLEVLFPNLKTGLLSLWIRHSNGKILHYERDPGFLRRNAMQFTAAYGRPMQMCLRLARVLAFSRLPKLTELIQQVRPLNVCLPFLGEQFTTRASLFYETEFLLEEQPNSYIIRQ
ncbi:hypothetical protein TYRP_012883 [Tyrophagus putrescentiae]|nr:hypothetical protein TYRP_012883 [Tyrophagus putrescentiae]